MSFDEARFARALRTRHGVITFEQLKQLGATKRNVSTLVRTGRLIRRSRGVYSSSAAPDTFEQRMVIACAATGGVVMYPTAGTVWDLRKTPGTTHIHVWIEHGRRVAVPPGVVVHRTTALEPIDVVRRADGVRVTSPPRTMFDASALLSHEALESVIEQGITRGWFTIPTLWATGRRLCGRGRAGSGRFAEVLSRRSAWRRPVDSDHELRLERALHARGFPQLTRQHRLDLGGGMIVHPDLGVPELGFFIEVDHVTWHGGRYDSSYDKRRDMKVRARGYQVERVPDDALDHHLTETVEDLWTLWQQCLARAAASQAR